MISTSANILGDIIATLINVYIWMIFAYILLTWFPNSSWAQDIRRVLASFCEPFLKVFRSLIPPMGGIDFTPVIAIFALQILSGVIRWLL